MRFITILSSVLVVSQAVGQVPDARLRDRLAGETLRAVSVLVEQATAMGLPREPLVQKALEGVSKGATGPQIEQAVRDLSDRLERAAGVLGRNAAESDLVAAAGAIYLGVSAETLRDVATSYEVGSLAVPLVVLTDMIRKGVAMQTASQVIVSLARANVDAGVLRQFREQVERDIGLGAAPSEAAMVRAQGVMLHRRPRIPNQSHRDATVPGDSP